MNDTLTWLWWIPLLPLGGAAFNLFLGPRLGKRAVAVVGCGVVLAAFGVAVAGFLRLCALDPERRALGGVLARPWIDVGNIHVNLGLLLDPLSAAMILVVTGVGFLIHLYSTAYMAEDARFSRYFAYLNLFTAAMLMLVLGDNMLLMFLGWEGVGLCSYLLIGFWFEQRKNAVAGMKAFVVNRVGDYGFTIGMLLLFVTVGAHAGAWTLDFFGLQEVFRTQGDGLLDQEGVRRLLTLSGILLFVGAIGKSAQIPLYVWLPDAMAGPTPVSALIHAATMVTAGVYMVARMNFVYQLAPLAADVVATVGACTALFAATIGLVQNDIKKVLAYSTVSQLGYMFLGVGVGAFAAGIFHVVTHAFFKACLFLGSGSIIHAMHHALPHGADPQDVRNMGGLKKHMKWTWLTFFVATLAIAGFPPFAGFFSKDEILWKAFRTEHYGLWFLAVCGAGLTAFYMFRLTFLTFYGNYRGGTPTVFLPPPEPAPSDVEGPAPADGLGDADGHASHAAGARGTHGHGPTSPSDVGHGAADSHAEGAGRGPHESPWPMTLPLVILAFLACVGGFLGLPGVIGDNAFERWMKPVVKPLHEGAAEAQEAMWLGLSAHAWEWLLMIVSVGIAAAGALTAYVFYIRRPELPGKLAAAYADFYRLLLDKYRVDELYQAAVVRPLLALERWCARFDLAVIDGAVNGFARFWAGLADYSGWVDNRIVDGAVNATAEAVAEAGRRSRRLQTGRIRNYLAYSLLGVLVLAAAYNVWMSRDAVHHAVRRVMAWLG